MTDQIKATFAAKAAKNEAVFVSFVTAGFPTKDDTVQVLLALEQGGADVIELGVPFSDPQADGPAIQESNQVALEQGVGYTQCLDYVRQHAQEVSRHRTLHGLLQPYTCLRRRQSGQGC